MARCLFLNSLILRTLIYILFIHEALSYEKVFLENAKLCSLTDNHETTVKLGEGEHSSKIALQSKYFERWSGKYKFFCTFLVRAPTGFGVYAVIQNLSFRKDEINGLCKDYVEFEIKQSIFKKIFSEPIRKKFCGKISPKSYLSLSEENHDLILNHSHVSENGFVTKSDEIKVTISIANVKLQPGEKLDINVVFTSFKYDCNERKNSIECKKCEWIWEDLNMDGIQNCPYSSCLDEDFCKNLKHEIRTIVSSGTGTKVSIGAVATIILGLLMFAFCVYICRRMQILCFNQNRNRQARIEMNNQQNPRLQENVTPYGDVLPEFAPSAPQISTEKDLPPSYSSLFPEK